MPWVWDNSGTGNGRRRNRTRVNRNTRRSYRSGGYDNGYDNGYGDDYERPDTYRSGDDYWDGGLYDRGGNRVRLTIQTPSDMQPARSRATELPNGNLMRSRARF